MHIRRIIKKLLTIIICTGASSIQLAAPSGNPAVIITELTSQLSFASSIPIPKEALNPYQIIPYILAYAPNNQAFTTQLNQFFFDKKECVDLKNNTILHDIKVIAQIALYLRYDVLNDRGSDLFALDHLLSIKAMFSKPAIQPNRQITAQNNTENTTLSRNVTSYQSLTDLASLNS